MNEQRVKRISKYLSLILRHEPEKVGLQLDSAGWANVAELLNACARHGFRFTLEELNCVVANNDKKRFAFSEDSSRIRASQGHSISIDLGLEPTQPPEFLYHGTAERNLSSILQQGLVKRDRQHVHLSRDHETAVKVGSRHGKPVVLKIMSGRMFTDGHEFYISANGVWLTDAVPAKYLVLDA